jgi:hypothetical protein
MGCFWQKFENKDNLYLPVNPLCCEMYAKQFSNINDFFSSASNFDGVNF